MAVQATAAGKKMICKECGDPMNHHADKLVDPISAQEAAHMDKAMGGIIEEMHYCAQCGRGDSRRL
jgi:ribosomal protein L37E